MNKEPYSDKAMRKKKEIDFLDNIYQPISLHADGSVGALEDHTVKRVIIKRHEQTGRELRRTIQVKELAEASVYKTLAGYVAATRRGSEVPMDSMNDEWRITPDDQGWKAYEAWRDNSDELSLSELIIRAHELADRSWRIDEDETTACAKCPEEKQYACRLTGWSREIYKYPLVRYSGKNGQQYDVPCNVANLIAIRARVLQEPLTVTTTHKFESDGSLTGMKYLTLDVSTIPRSYAAGRPISGDVTIDPSEPLASGVHILIGTWAENKKVEDLLHHRYRFDNGAITPDDMIKQMQYKVTQDMYHERVESIDYDERLDELRTKVGKLGLALTYQIRYAGMGESDAAFSLTKPEYGYEPMTRLSYSADAREGVDDALEYLSKYKAV